MRLVTCAGDAGKSELGFVIDDQAYSFAKAVEALGGWNRFGASPDSFENMIAFIEGGKEALQAARRIAKTCQTADDEARAAARGGQLLAPIPRPRKNVMCVGRNYAEHARERGAEAPGEPVFFTKAPTTVVGPDAKVPYPKPTTQFDYEVELAVIIGRRGRDIPREEALDYVFGYTIANDLTARDLQKRHMQWFRGKSLDGTCPMGPWIVTADELGPIDDLQLETRVNGQLRQQGTTAHMIFDVPTLISILSDGMTLEPGDIIITGTPAGVGAATDGLLKPGDRVDLSISGIGTLTTYIVAE